MEQPRMPIQQRQGKQTWQKGDRVKVGFLDNLTVDDIELTPGDFRPDRYILTGPTGRRYQFTPHYGIERID